MSEGLLSLQWNNHKSTLSHMLSNVRRKENYADTTLACGGKFYPVHKLILSMCSEYFEQIFEQTTCKHPVIVLKDIKCEELECLLNYMYLGEVNVVQEKLSGLIKAAECLRIKGLAVPDEDPSTNKSSNKNITSRGTEKRTSDDTYSSSDAKRRKADSFSSESTRERLGHSNIQNEPRRSSDQHSSSNGRSFRSHSNSDSHSISSDQPRKSSTVALDKQDNSRERKRSLAAGTSPAADSEVILDGDPEIKEEQYDAPPVVTVPEPQQLLIDNDMDSSVKEEPTDDDIVYYPDNSTADHKGSMLEGLVEADNNQMHFMEELLGGQNSGSAHGGDMGHMGVGDPSSSAAGASHQQHMITKAGPSGGGCGGLRMPMWTQHQVASLMGLVESYQDEMRANVTKKITIWEQITIELNEIHQTSYSKAQVSLKYRNTLRGYRRYIQDLEKGTGSIKKPPPFFAELSRIVGNRELEDMPQITEISSEHSLSESGQSLEATTGAGREGEQCATAVSSITTEALGMLNEPWSFN